MEVIATNIGERREVSWRGKKVVTGIYKSPVDSILLESTDVRDDHVIDRRYHGGVDKACYLYGADAYAHWKTKHPHLDWQWGMFGENITIDTLDESQICIGDRYQIGQATVEVSQPRQPCFKLGIRFGTQQVLKQFIVLERSGVYVRVLEPGHVRSGDQMTLISKGSNISIQQIFQMVYNKNQNPEIIQEALALKTLAASAHRDIQKHFV